MAAVPTHTTPATVSNRLTALISQYAILRHIAKYCTGNDIIHLGHTSYANMTALKGSAVALRGSWAYGVEQCDGSGLLRWHGDRTRVEANGPYYQCLDTLFQIPSAKPCDRCGVAVCNICRFHLDRGNTHYAGSVKKRAFDDEIDTGVAGPASRPAWRTGGYRLGPSLARSDETKAQRIIAGQRRMYCEEHMQEKRTKLREKLRPAHLPGPLCTCNPTDSLVRKRWLCIPCFENEYRAVRMDWVNWGPITLCRVDGCKEKATDDWKQCCVCELLIEPCKVTGHNCVHRTVEPAENDMRRWRGG